MQRKEFEAWKKVKETHRAKLLAVEESEASQRNDSTYSYTNRWEHYDLQKNKTSINAQFDSEIESERLKMEEEERKRGEWVPDNNFRPIIINFLIAATLAFLAYWLSTHRPF